MRFFRSSAAVAMLLFCVVLSAQERPYEFEEEILIAVAGTDNGLVPEAPAQYRLEKLFSAAPPAGGVVLEGVPPETRTWYKITPIQQESVVAVARSTQHPWDLAHDVVDKKSVRTELNSVRDDLAQRGMRVVEIEPNVAFEFRSTVKKTPPCTQPTVPDTVALCGDFSVYWPPKKRSLGWHAEEDYSQLKPAREAAAKFFPPDIHDPKLVTIAHLDTGYDKADDMSRPKQLDLQASFTFLPRDEHRCGLADWTHERLPGCDRFIGLTSGHGPSTLSILAGNRVKYTGSPAFPAYDDYLGGAPLARIMSNRVSGSVILIWPTNVATAIDHVAGKADVISMSMGGLPSGALRDAVNKAYDNGTAMFFATGDYIRVPIPIFDIHSPRGVVYPARFNRATPVAGITQVGKSYGVGPSWLSLLFHRFSGTFSWMLRGSHGPASKMNYAISAYTPNVTKHYADKEGITNVIAPSFEGTSAATPQVAAAAALWLQAHRDDPELSAKWRTWQKTEAVYHALLKSTKPVGPVSFFGRGALQANKALAEQPDLNLQPRPPATIGRDWLSIIARLLGVPQDTEPLHAQMLRTEILQLVTTSPRLQRVVAEHDIDFDSPSPPSQEALKALRVALFREKRASQTLRKALRVRVVVVPIPGIRIGRR